MHSWGFYSSAVPQLNFGVSRTALAASSRGVTRLPSASDASALRLTRRKWSLGTPSDVDNSRWFDGVEEEATRKLSEVVRELRMKAPGFAGGVVAVWTLDSRQPPGKVGGFMKTIPGHSWPSRTR